MSESDPRTDEFVTLMKTLIDLFTSQKVIIHGRNNLVNRLNYNISVKSGITPNVFPNCIDVFLRRVKDNLNSTKFLTSQTPTPAPPDPAKFEDPQVTYQSPTEFLSPQKASHTLDFFNEYFTYNKSISNSSGDDVHLAEDESSKEKGCCCLSESSYYEINGRRKHTFSVKRFYLGDLVWLFYMDRMGIFKIITALLDDFKTSGKYRLNNSDTDATILEAMLRELNSGNGSTSRDRNASYLKCLGWVTDTGRKLNLDVQNNQKFGSSFHQFIQHALHYYNARRVAVAIKSTAQADGTASASTRESIRNLLIEIEQARDPFKYGRTVYNVLNGIVWVIASIDVIEHTKEKIGVIEESFDTSRIIDSAYTVLVENKPLPTWSSNRYVNHLTCAKNARRILLDLEQLDISESTNSTSGRTDLEMWLDEMESSIEAYRAAYRNITGVDLGKQKNDQTQLPSLTI